MNRLLFLLLMLLVVFAPLPLGSNREWSWTLCALLAALLAALWALTRVWRPQEVVRLVHPAIVALFLLACGWIVIQTSGWVPAGWKHPLWAQAAQVLGTDLNGSISLAAEDGWTSLMRLLAYALVFFLAFQLGNERSRAHAFLGWIFTAGVVYAVFGLVAYWGIYSPEFLFGNETGGRAVHGTFVNRNHFVTWAGLTLLCAVAMYYLQMARSDARPYDLPQDRTARFEKYVLRAWLPLTGMLLIVAALMLTHSRGGFFSAVAGLAALLYLLDTRTPRNNLVAKITVSAAVVVVSIAFYMTSAVLLDRLDRTEIANEERLVVYEQVRQGIRENPVLGFGYGTFADSFRLYDRVETPEHYDRAHNTWLENLFELGVPAALALFAAIAGLALTCWRGVRRRHRDWAIPAVGVAASVLVGVHALFDFSLQIPAVAILYAAIMGVACAQSRSSTHS